MYITCTETTQPSEMELQKTEADGKGEFALLLCPGVHTSKVYVWPAYGSNFVC